MPDEPGAGEIDGRNRCVELPTGCFGHRAEVPVVSFATKTLSEQNGTSVLPRRLAIRNVLSLTPSSRGSIELVITLPVPPLLVEPTTTVRMSYLTGEQADCLLRGTNTDWLGPASEEFDQFVAARQGVTRQWNVPATIYWYVAAEHYIGSLVIRHELTDELLAVGGHIGYHVVAPWRHQGHATQMLADALPIARSLGLDRVLLTCDPANEPSQRVIVANGGQPDKTLASELRFWIHLT